MSDLHDFKIAPQPLRWFHVLSITWLCPDCNATHDSDAFDEFNTGDGYEAIKLKCPVSKRVHYWTPEPAKCKTCDSRKSVKRDPFCYECQP